MVSAVVRGRAFLTVMNMLKVFGYLFAGMIIATTAACSGRQDDTSSNAEVDTNVRIVRRIIGTDFPCFDTVSHLEKYIEALHEDSVVDSGRAFAMSESAPKIHPGDKVQIIGNYVDKSSILKDEYTHISFNGSYANITRCWVPAIPGLFETPLNRKAPPSPTTHTQN